MQRLLLLALCLIVSVLMSGCFLSPKTNTYNVVGMSENELGEPLNNCFITLYAINSSKKLVSLVSPESSFRIPFWDVISLAPGFKVAINCGDRYEKEVFQRRYGEVISGEVNLGVFVMRLAE